MKSYWNYWRRYADFHGTTTVGEFWLNYLWFILVGIFFLISVPVVSVVVFRLSVDEYMRVFEILRAAYGVVNVVPLCAVTVRRLNDAGYSWKSLFWLLVPGIGLLAILARLCTNRCSDS